MKVVDSIQRYYATRQTVDCVLQFIHPALLVYRDQELHDHDQQKELHFVLHFVYLLRIGLYSNQRNKSVR